ncbi:DUF2497 domain-containing protein [Microbaculum marinum]|uniref:DUF2497 domain-containing protein n=1 Tax=Microbaculum marinum TaxID=1764581 RepID=A0AAW9RVA1_9HYPH
MEEILASIRRIISESDDGVGLSGSAASLSGRGDPARAAQAAAAYEQGSAPRPPFRDEAPAGHDSYLDPDHDVPPRTAVTGDAYPAGSPAPADDIFELTDDMVDDEVAGEGAGEGEDTVGGLDGTASADPVEEPFQVPHWNETPDTPEETAAVSAGAAEDLGDESGAQGAADQEPAPYDPLDDRFGEPAPAADAAPGPFASAAPASVGTTPPADRAAAVQGLLSARSDAMISSAFGRLAETMPPATDAATAPRAPRTLEDFVGEMLRPMLKEWLDENLPVIVEQLVQQEIERVSRGRR